MNVDSAAAGCDSRVGIRRLRTPRHFQPPLPWARWQNRGIASGRRVSQRLPPAFLEVLRPTSPREPNRRAIAANPVCRRILMAERCSRSESSRAEGGDKGCRPFPRTLFSTAPPCLRCASDSFSLTKPNSSCTQSKCQRRCAPRTVRLRPGMPFAFPPESVFTFGGIPNPCRTTVRAGPYTAVRDCHADISSNNDGSPSDLKYALESPTERALARARYAVK
jgi:hypothetical protein